VSKTKKQQGLQLPAALELRDVFAAAAMAGWQACPNTNATTAAAVKYCYEVADEMMAKRRVNGSSREIAAAKADALREFAGQFQGYHDDANWYADDICKRLNDAADEIIREANK
jgi:hypothetical protein